MGISVRFCTLKHIVVNRLQKLANLCCNLIQRYRNLLMRITANQNCLIFSNISRSDLDTYRNTAHLGLAELPSRRFVGIIHFDTEVGQNLFYLKCLVQNTLFCLLDRNDHNLGRSYLRRQNQTIIVTMNHDDRAYHTGCHTPGSLMNIF